MSELGSSLPPAEQSKSEQAREKVQGTTQQLRQRTQPAMGRAREMAQERAEQMRGQAGGRLREQLDTRSTPAGERVSTIAEAVRTTSEQLRSRGQEGPAKVADQAAERADRVGTYLRDSDGDRILNDIQDFARRQPWLVAVIGGIAGFLAARFVKASSAAETGDGRYTPAWEEERPMVEPPVVPSIEPSAPPPGPVTGV